MQAILCSLLVAQTALPHSLQAPQPGQTLAWGDYDADGRRDLLVLDGRGPARLLRNRGDGGFDDVSARAGLDGAFVPRVGAWVDVDADGRLDLLLGGADGLQLLRGDGATFRDATAVAGLDGAGAVQSLAWTDYDGDGLDDLETTGGGARLYRGLGDGVFAPVDLGLPALEDGRVTRVLSSAGDEAAAGSSLASSAAPGMGSATPGGPRSAAAAAGICAGSILDAALGGCIPASSVPALGALLPLSVDLNLDLAGNVGMGTTSPASKLHVVGDVRAEGRLISTVASGAPLTVASSARVTHLNADLLDGLDASAFSQLGGSIESSEITDGTIVNADLATGSVDTTKIADGTILNSDVSSSAAIAGTKVSPDFGAQTIRTTGSAGVGTTAPEGRLHVLDASAGNMTAHGNSIAVFEGSGKGFVSILAPDGTAKGLFFGNPSSSSSGGIVYDQASVGAESMQLRTGGNATRMTITQAGDVGIGTTAPQYDLHVRGDSALGTLVVTPGVSDSQAEVRLTENTSASLGMVLRYNGGNNDFELRGFNAATESDVHFFADRDSGYAGFPSSAARVGIGTASPSGRLHVVDASGGDGSVVLPSSSISDSEILDEPGIAHAKGETPVSLTSGTSTLLTRSITAPTSGYVYVTATMTVGVGAFSGGNAYYGVNTDGNLSNGSLEYRYFSDAGTVSDAHQVSHQAVFSVSAGTTTFYLQAQEISGALNVTNRRLNLLFVPTAYGSVSTK